MENKCYNKELKPDPSESNTLHQEMTSLVPSGCKSGSKCVGKTGLEKGWSNCLRCFQLITMTKRNIHFQYYNRFFLKVSVKI